MNEINDTRLKNARSLAKEYKTLAAFAEAIERAPTQVSRFMGKKPTKKIGDQMARHMEKCLKKPKGWLDNEHHRTTSGNHSLIDVISAPENDIELLKAIITTVEEITLEEDINLTPAEKAQTIISCLKACIRHGTTIHPSKEAVTSAIYTLKV